MLLKRGMKISSANTLLNWLSKRAVKVVANGKISTFFCESINHKINDVLT